MQAVEELKQHAIGPRRNLDGPNDGRGALFA